jgi:hypothetical protein
MGWTCYYSKPQSVRAEILDIFTSPTLRPVAIGNYGSTYYVAAEVMEGEDKGQVIGGVVLTSTKHGDWCYKAMTSDMGPYEVKCPKNVLTRINAPKEGTCAREWWDKCWAWHDRPKPKTGDWVQLHKAWEPYGEFFQKVQHPKRGVYRSRKTGELVRLGTPHIAKIVNTSELPA